jgi:hypothetical protein
MIIAGTKSSFETPFVDINVNSNDSIKVIKKAFINQVDLSLFFFSSVFFLLSSLLSESLFSVLFFTNFPFCKKWRL